MAAAWGGRRGARGFSAAAAGAGASSSDEIRILDEPAREIPRWLAGFAALGMEEEDGGYGGVVVEEEEAMPAPMVRALGCDVYVGYGGGVAVERFVAWMRAEMEMLGVPCVVADRRRCRDAPAHAAACAAMDVAVVGVVLVTPGSLSNPYCVEEIRMFVERGKLLPVLVGLCRADCNAEDIVQKSGDLWERFGGHLWKLYDGAEKDWREAVDALSKAEIAVEVDAGNQRNRLIDLLEILTSRLGRRAMTEAVRSWRAAAYPELPFLRNAGFVGRERELLDLEAVLLGGARSRGKRPMHMAEVDAYGETAFLNGVVCISGPSGAGKTELVLEFAHRHAQDYKKVLWVRGEARYLRFGYLKLADQLGLAVGDDLSIVAAAAPSRKRWIFHGIESDSIAKIRKELTREIPYLLVIDNLESETDWWDSRPVQELLPSACERSHVIVTTRLNRLQRIRTFMLPNLTVPEAMRLMKGMRAYGSQDTLVLRDIEKNFRSVPLGLALVGAILSSELAVSPSQLRQAMYDAPYRAPTWEEKDEPALRDNPGLVQLIDACFALLDEEKAGLGTAAAKMLETSGFFAPAPIPVALLAVASGGGGADGERLWKRMMRSLHISCASAREPSNSSGRRSAEPEALEALLRIGIARRCTQAGCVSVHRVFRLFSLKVGSSQAGLCTIRAIAARASVKEHADHVWEACLSLFKLAPAVAVELPTQELGQFVTRLVVPLAAHGAAAYSSYGAVLDLLAEATDAVRAEEERYVAAPSRRSGGDLDPIVYHEIVRSRAELLKLRAKLMLRGGEYALAENHCMTAIGILEVVSGEDGPETDAANEILDQILKVQLDN
ncbi:hypothetical protein GUJ93_ZPchr0011g28540 [Zizania palustris]|uniref:AAA+ ATPase domain-containing protein n=1 Tax=Zizania palustris TaxID=103762 RepID=A0A8J5WKF1_ZIZPA|nr:hypothetical protein GUJ93_ZPchr0011g28540 [Zizania palustris]